MWGRHDTELELTGKRKTIKADSRKGERGSNGGDKQSVNYAEVNSVN